MTTKYSKFLVFAPEHTRDAIATEFPVMPLDEEWVERHREYNSVEQEPVQVAASNPELDADSPELSPGIDVHTFVARNDLPTELIGSKPIRDPYELPEEFQPDSPMDIYDTAYEDGAILDIIDDVMPADAKDARWYISDIYPRTPQTIKFDVCWSLNDGTGVNGLEPIPADTLNDLLDADLTTKGKGTQYPTAEDILSWRDELHEDFPDARVYAIGMFSLPCDLHPDGRAETVGFAVAPATEELYEWLDDRFGAHWDENIDEYVVHSDDYLTAAEFSSRDDVPTDPDGVIRLWWD